MNSAVMKLVGCPVLEETGRVKIVALDKTGTITSGHPSVTDIIPFGKTKAELVHLAASLEWHSEYKCVLGMD